MTKEEAIALEALCEKYLEEEIENGVELSMSFTGKLKIRFSTYDVFFTVSRVVFTVSRMLDDVVYVVWSGSYREMQRTIKKILRCIDEHREDFEKLLWAYENRSLLTGDENDET